MLGGGWDCEGEKCGSGEAKDAGCENGVMEEESGDIDLFFWHPKECTVEMSLSTRVNSGMKKALRIIAKCLIVYLHFSTTL